MVHPLNTQNLVERFNRAAIFGRDEDIKAIVDPEITSVFNGNGTEETFKGVEHLLQKFHTLFNHVVNTNAESYEYTKSTESEITVTFEQRFTIPGPTSMIIKGTQTWSCAEIKDKKVLTHLNIEYTKKISILDCIPILGCETQ
ncbi:hypothetical protein COB11_00275 [Candidatus Aerophobetes bacterium]|uniref:SnoaL-like domain-containing protein n=1 Tax=Aerophobetes bacterium TaxID=2030807 RepID=A0A2A4YMW1_UNCAE|nr:MAG: hypothetical protein COB11_00275 [Candidatus Aerophobetes bacterium]